MVTSKCRGISVYYIFKDEYSAVSRIMKSYTVILALCFVILVMTQQATSEPAPEPHKDGGGGNNYGHNGGGGHHHEGGGNYHGDSGNYYGGGGDYYKPPHHKPPHHKPPHYKPPHHKPPYHGDGGYGHH